MASKSILQHKPLLQATEDGKENNGTAKKKVAQRQQGQRKAGWWVGMNMSAVTPRDQSAKLKCKYYTNFLGYIENLCVSTEEQTSQSQTQSQHSGIEVFGQKMHTVAVDIS